MKNENWNLSGLILEGISGTGKTALLQALVKSERYRGKPYLSSIILTEHQTQRVLEKKGRAGLLRVPDSVDLLDSHVAYLERLNENLEQMEWCRKNQTNMRIPYILERFHLTHVYQYEHMSWDDVSPIDSRLSGLNCKLCLLTAGKDELNKRLFSGRDAQWMNYIQRFGKNTEEIAGHFIRQQNHLLELAENSGLETLVIDTGITGIDETLNMIIDFWGVF